MATIPTPEQSAREILSIFVTHANMRPGNSLQLNHFFGIWIERGLHDEDLKHGMDYAQEKGWVEIHDNGYSFRLTESGFAQAEDRYQAPDTTELSVTQDKIATLTSDGRRVFIVHGHDLDSLEKLDHLLRKIGLEPENVRLAQERRFTDYHRSPRKKHADLRAVVALLTPDDEGRKRPAPGEPSEAHEPWKPRARQNVLIEAGYAIISRRNRSLIVALGEVEIPSDFEGISRLQNHSWSKELAAEVAKRFSQMGFSVNLGAVI